MFWDQNIRNATHRTQREGKKKKKLLNTHKFVAEHFIFPPVVHLLAPGMDAAPVQLVSFARSRVSASNSARSASKL